MDSYKCRVEERRAWQLAELNRTIYAAALGLMIVNIAMAVFVAVYLGGVK